jgi:hypothetical protein
MTTFTAQITQSSDDAHQGTSISGAPVSINGTDIILSSSVSSFASHGAWRWQNVTIAANTTATACTITLDFDVAGTGDTLSFDFQNSSNAATFAASNNNITTRTKTGHAVSLATPASTGNTTTPDMSTAATAVFAVAGWASGNAMAGIETSGAQTTDTSVLAWDNSSSSTNTALLSVTYSAGGGSGTTGGIRPIFAQSVLTPMLNSAVSLYVPGLPT